MQILSQILQSFFSLLMENLVIFIPQFFVAVIFLWAGWLISLFLEKVILVISRALKIDRYVKYTGIHDFLGRGGVKFDAGVFLGASVKWLTAFVFLLSSLQVLGFPMVGAFVFQGIFTRLPLVLITVFLLLFTSLGAKVLKHFVTAFARSFGISSANFLGIASSALVWGVVLFLMISQTGLTEEYLKIIFIGVVSMVSLAFGLAFGLGGKEEAGMVVTKIRKNISEHF